MATNPTDATAASRLIVDLDAVAANWRHANALAAPGRAAAVVKANAYGLGAVPVVRRLLREGVRELFVARFEEALALRPEVPGDIMLAVLDGLGPGEDREAAAFGLVPVLNDLGAIERWSALARARGERLAAILHLDTGMNRLGLGAREVERLAQDPTRLDAIDLRFVMTHFVASECPEEGINGVQLRLFHERRARLPPAPTSIANSSGLFLGPTAASDLARPGAALYGLNPTPGRPNPMRPVVTVEARILQLREIEAGEAVGYNATWRARRPTRIATVAAGYADGYHRSLSNRGVGSLAGRRAPIVGRVSMDLITLDVTDIPEALPGAMVRLIGPEIPPDEVAEAAGTNGYEILTALGAARHQRIYLGAA
ncbi:MAG: alanine racemase [Acetobacteraceae bacterium]|nr:alanine racemase [Acetobacteraceae bacterium]